MGALGLIAATLGFGVAVKSNVVVIPPPSVPDLKPEPTRRRRNYIPERHHLPGRNISKLCDEFVQWMRDNDSYGYHTVEEIDTYLDYYCESIAGVMTPEPNTARSRLNECLGVESNRYRLKAKFPEIYAETGRDRCVLYRISSHQEMARRYKTRPSRMEKARVRPVPTSRPGQPTGAAGRNSKHKTNPKPRASKKQVNKETYEMRRAA